MRVYFAQTCLTTGCRAVSTYCIMNSVHASRYYNVYILNDDQNFTNRRASVNTNTKTNLGCCIANMSGVLKMVLKNVNCTPELHFTELQGLL